MFFFSFFGSSYTIFFILNSCIHGVDLCYSDAGEAGAKEPQGDITKLKVQHAVDVTKLKNNQREQLKQTPKHRTKHTLIAGYTRLTTLQE